MYFYYEDVDAAPSVLDLHVTQAQESIPSPPEIALARPVPYGAEAVRHLPPYLLRDIGLDERRIKD